MGAVLLLLASFAVILVGALVFTNAVEWAGHRLDMGQGAVGSLLAAVGTAMPETLIPIVAIIGGAEGSEDVAVGAIIGAPFLLATIAMGLVGVSALIYRNRREQGTELSAHAPDARARPRLLPDLLRASGSRVGAADLPDGGPDPAGRRCSSWPTPTTSAARSRAAARSRTSSTIGPLMLGRRSTACRCSWTHPADAPPHRLIAAAVRARARGDRRRRPPVRRGAPPRRRGRRHRRRSSSR